ncbi:P-loop containing nucleoside triphosphate hydrolase protein [Aspergillus unguis]
MWARTIRARSCLMPRVTSNMPVQPALPTSQYRTFVNTSSKSTNDALQPYTALNGRLDSKLLDAVNVLGFKQMTPVQQRVLTELPDWRSDCLVQAKTGTGKTVAFLLPTLHSILNGAAKVPRGQVSTLIIAPTRELAQQIAKSCDELTSTLDRPLECHIAVGGRARSSNLKKFLNGNPSVLVATPGRLLDYLSEPEAAMKFSNMKTLILDEADTMLETGFLVSVKQILAALPPKRTGWQGMCFSATIPPSVKDVLSVVLDHGYKSISTIDENETPTIERISQQHVIMPSVLDSVPTLASLLEHETKKNSKIIVFASTANLTALYYDVFSKGLLSLPVLEMHSRLSQKHREAATAEFKAAKSGVLFASDVVGRGMDFPNVDLVIQVGLPDKSEQYVHRVGRTARAGKGGRAIILLTEGESWFLSKNPQFPITPHPETAVINKSSPSYAGSVLKAMSQVEDIAKERAYTAYLGFLAASSRYKKLGIDKPGAVQLANKWAVEGMGCPEPPAVKKVIVNKMGYKGVPGLRFMSQQEIEARNAPGRPKRA